MTMSYVGVEKAESARYRNLLCGQNSLRYRGQETSRRLYQRTTKRPRKYGDAVWSKSRTDVTTLQAVSSLGLHSHSLMSSVKIGDSRIPHSNGELPSPGLSRYSPTACGPRSVIQQSYVPPDLLSFGFPDSPIHGLECNISSLRTAPVTPWPTFCYSTSVVHVI